ncbi:MAG: hypothetical protein J6328_04175 [Bacilli bacterium]|nr:hypothetical protein [Bacilli bacterium]
MKWFNSQSRLVQIILLLIPGINWIVEVIVRVTAVLEKPNGKHLLGLIFGIFIPIINGWVDLIWVLLFNHLLLAK